MNNASSHLNINTQFSVLFGLAAFWALMVASRYFTVSWIGERVTADLRSAVYRRVMHQSPQFFETLQTGEVLSRLTGDTTLIQIRGGQLSFYGLTQLVSTYRRDGDAGGHQYLTYVRHQHWLASYA